MKCKGNNNQPKGGIIIKKRIIVVLLSFTMVTATMSGCSDSKKSSAPEKDKLTSDVSSELVNQQTDELISKTVNQPDSDAGNEPVKVNENNNGTDENFNHENKDSEEKDSIQVSVESKEREAYIAFLSGNGSVTTAPVFQEDDDEENYDGLFYGEYSYPDLKVIFENFQGSETTTKYTFIDCGNDGTEEMVVRLSNVDPVQMSWVGIIHYEDGKLELTYSYQDGARTEAHLYKTGYLTIGGSWGAGAYGMNYVEFNGKGEANALFSRNHFYCSFSTQIAYDLNTDGMGMENSEYYSSVLGSSSTVEVTEYVPERRDGNGVKISVTNYSTDKKTAADEEQMIHDLVSMGAEVISEDEMNQLCNHPEFDGPEVVWTDWEEKCTILKVCDFNYVYNQPAEYSYAVCDDSEDAMEVMISTNKKITDVHILSLSMEASDNDGSLIYSGTEKAVYDELIPYKPLVVKMRFIGDTPSYGISYVDENREKQTMAIQMSGYDSSLFLEKTMIH